MKSQHVQKYFLFFTIFAFFICFTAGAETPTDPSSPNKITAKGETLTVTGPGVGILGGLVTTGGDFAGTFLAEFDFKLVQKASTRVGILSGIMFGSGTGLPILLSAVMHKQKYKGKNVPYVGVAVGPVLGLDGVGVFDGGPLGDSVRLAILLRLGMKWPLMNNVALVTEVMTGGLTGIFYISPMLGAIIRL